jgi:SAM-dependent methyltransferase
MTRWMACLAPQARVLDLACGRGRNTSLAMVHGAQVTGVDRDPAALATLPAGVTTVCADLEGQAWPPALTGDGRFDVILVANYLFLPRLDLLPACLAPGGLLLYETFGMGNARYGRPANPTFLLAAGELLRWAERHGLFVLAYENGFISRAGGAVVQRIAAIRPPVDLERFPLDGGSGDPESAAGSGVG